MSLDDVSNTSNLAVDLLICTTCSEHVGKEFEFYCKFHNSICCSECFYEGHRTCDKVFRLRENSEELLKEKKANVVVDRLKKVRSHLNRFENENEETMKKLEVECENMPDQIEEYRKKLNNLLDKAKNKIKMEKNALLKEESLVRDQENQHCQSMKFAITNFVYLLEKVLAYGNTLQILTTLHKIEEQLVRYESSVLEKYSEVRITDATLCLDNCLLQLNQADEACMGNIRTVESKKQLASQFPFTAVTEGQNKMKAIQVQNKVTTIERREQTQTMNTIYTGRGVIPTTAAITEGRQGQTSSVKISTSGQGHMSRKVTKTEVHGQIPSTTVAVRQHRDLIQAVTAMREGPIFDVSSLLTATEAIREGQSNNAPAAKFTFGRGISQAPAKATIGQVHYPTITTMTEGQGQTSTMKRTTRGQGQVQTTKIMTGGLEQAKTLKTKTGDQGISPTISRQLENFGQTRARNIRRDQGNFQMGATLMECQVQTLTMAIKDGADGYDQIPQEKIARSGETKTIPRTAETKSQIQTNMGMNEHQRKTETVKQPKGDLVNIATIATPVRYDYDNTSSPERYDYDDTSSPERYNYDDTSSPERYNYDNESSTDFSDIG